MRYLITLAFGVVLGWLIGGRFHNLAAGHWLTVQRWLLALWRRVGG